MARLTKPRSRKAGLPPGTLVHIGEQKRESMKISLIAFSENECEARDLGSVDECPVLNDPSRVVWINVEGLHDTAALERLGSCLSLHPLIMEDIVNTDQRPKIEDMDSYLAIIMKMIYYQENTETVVTEQISLIVGPSYVVSFQEGIAGDVFNPVRERLRTGKGKIRRMGADYLAYSLIDTIVDNYFSVLEKLGEDVETMEDQIVEAPQTKSLQQLHHLKRELIFLRKAVWPLREVISTLERVESPLIKDETSIYFKDVYDHTIQVIDTVETFRDIMAGMLDIYLSSVSNRLNAIMKVLTIIATIFMPLTFIVGVYGMNFEHMPELKWQWAYPALWGIMLAIGFSMLWYFRKKDWL